jgi:hypothetical protein
VAAIGHWKARIRGVAITDALRYHDANDPAFPGTIASGMHAKGRAKGFASVPGFVGFWSDPRRRGQGSEPGFDCVVTMASLPKQWRSQPDPLAGYRPDVQRPHMGSFGNRKDPPLSQRNIE